MSALSYVLEAYAGKSADLVKCEGYLREIIDLIIKDHQGKITSKRHVTRDAKPCKELENTLEKFFDIDDIAIYWNTGSINAYSVPGSSLIIANRSSSGDFRSARFHICIYENLVYDAGLNEKELMAVLLHEIGHCFYSSPVLVGGELLGYLMSPINIVMAFIGIGIVKGGNALSDWEKKKIPLAYNVINKFNDFTTQINYILKYLALIPNVSDAIRNASANLSNPFNVIGKYGGERGADSFAAKYGYGADMVSALKKLNRPENVEIVKDLNKAGGFGEFVLDYGDVINDLFAMISLDPHPTSDTRAQAMLRKLERDLRNGDYPPELQKDLQAEIARLNRIYSTINDNKGNVQIKKAWYNMLNVITNGHGNIQEIFNNYYEQYEF